MTYNLKDCKGVKRAEQYTDSGNLSRLFKCKETALCKEKMFYGNIVLCKASPFFREPKIEKPKK